MGRVLDQSSGIQRIVSVPTSSLLFFECPSSSTSSARIVLASLFNGLEQMRLKYGDHYLGLDAKKSGFTFVLDPKPGVYRGFDIPSRWLELGHAFSQDTIPPTILVCGPRKVGKSSFCRYITNNLLNFFPRVALADIDCGQTEFTPPGFISLKILQDALLGPSSRNIGAADFIQHLGFAGVDTSPKCYFSGVKRLFDDFAQVRGSETPMVINTMGWVTGLGFALLQQIVRLIRPSHLVVMKVETQDENSVPDYVWDALYGHKCELRIGPCSPFERDDPIQVAAVSAWNSAAASDGDKTRYEAKELRDIATRVYFHQLDITNASPTFDFSKNISEFVPVVVPWHLLQLVIPGGKEWTTYENIFALLNLAIIGIASKISIAPGLRIYYNSYEWESPNVFCAGLIRAVDPLTRTLHLLVPTTIDILNSKRLFTLLIRPGWLLSSSLVAQENVESRDAPYLSTISSYAKGAIHNRKSRSNIQRRHKEL